MLGGERGERGVPRGGGWRFSQEKQFHSWFTPELLRPKKKKQKFVVKNEMDVSRRTKM